MALNQIEIFFSYSEKDEKLRDELAKHLRGLERNRVITAWHDSEISAGQERTEEIEKHLNSAIIILLLVSPDYIASDELWERQVTQAMQRHEQKEARVIPVLLRDYHGLEDMPFGKLQPLPRNGKPITDQSWQSQDAAFKDVVKGIQQAVKEVSRQKILADPTKPFIIKLFRLIPWFLLFKAFASSSGVSIVVMLMRLYSGILEPSELWFYDHMMSSPLQTKEAPDKRLLIVEITSDDIKKYGRPSPSPTPQDKFASIPQYGASLGDKTIHHLLEKLLKYKDKTMVIGFDIYRDFPAYYYEKKENKLDEKKENKLDEKKENKLDELFNKQDNKDRLIFICKLSDHSSNNDGNDPPPGVDKEQVGFSDLVFDKDGTLRRQLLLRKPPDNSKCTNDKVKTNETICGTMDALMESFSFKIAQKYLELEKNKKFECVQEGKNGILTFNNKISLERLERNNRLGGYNSSNPDNYKGYQILLRYRNVAKSDSNDKNFFKKSSQDSIFNIAEKQTVQNILEKTDEELKKLVENKIILIGAEAEAYECPSPTPFSNGGSEAQMRGLYIQAHQVSRIVNAALEQKDGQLLTVSTVDLDFYWIMFWAILGAICAYSLYKEPKKIMTVNGVFIFILYIFCLGLFILQKKWVPFTSAAIAYLGTGAIIILIEHQPQKTKSKSNYP